MILSDLAKYSMTRSVVRSLCNSWASCTHYCVLSLARILAFRNSQGTAMVLTHSWNSWARGW